MIVALDNSDIFLIQDGAQILEGSFGVDAKGNYVVIDGTITTQASNGLSLVEQIAGGRRTNVIFKDINLVNLFRVDPLVGQTNIMFDGNFNVFSGHLSGQGMNSAFIVQDRVVRDLDLKPLDQASISVTERQYLLGKWQLTDVQLDQYINIIAHDVVANPSAYDVSREFFRDLFGAIVSSDLPAFNQFSTLVQNGFSQIMNVFQTANSLVANVLEIVKQKITYYTASFESRFLNSRPLDNVSLIYDHIFNRNTVYYDGIGYPGDLPSIGPSSTTVQIINPRSSDWQVVSEVAVVSLAGKVSVFGKAILDQVQQLSEQIPPDRLNNPELRDQLGNLLNDLTAGKSLGAAIAGVDFLNIIVGPSVEAYNEAIKANTGVYYVELQRKFVDGGLPQFRWTAYYLTNDNPPVRKPLPGTAGANFIKRLLQIAAEILTQG